MDHLLPCGLETLEYPPIASQASVREADPLLAEKELWTGVVREAIRCVQGRACVAPGLTPKEARAGLTNREKRIRKLGLEKRRARQWFKSTSTQIGSFAWVCGALGWEQGEILRRLRQLPGVTL